MDITVYCILVLQAFQQARAGAPSILFIDETESLVGKRSSGSKQKGAQERVLSTLLNEIDGIGLRTEDLQQAPAGHMIAEGESQEQKVRFQEVILVRHNSKRSRHETVGTVTK